MKSKVKRRVVTCVRPVLKFNVAPRTPDATMVKGRCGHAIYSLQDLRLDEHNVGHSSVERFSIWAAILGFAWRECSLCMEEAELAKAIVCGMCGTLILQGHHACVIAYPGDANRLPFWKYATRTTQDSAVVVCTDKRCGAVGFLPSIGRWDGENIVFSD